MATRSKSQLIGNVSTGASFAGIVTATELSSDTVNISGVATISNVKFSSGIVTSTSGVVTYYGDGSGLSGIEPSPSISDDTSTDASFFPVFTQTTSGILTTVNTSTTKLNFNPSSSVLHVGSGITLSGSDGSISIAGTIYASSMNIPIEVTSFSPPIGTTDVGFGTNIILTLNQFVGLGTTGFLEIKSGSATTGTVVETIYPSDSNVTLTNGSTVLEINPSSGYPASSEIFAVMSSEFIVGNNVFAGINTVGTGVTYSFTTKSVSLGDAFEGGFLICQAGGTRWIVAPSSTQVTRDWNNGVVDSIALANAQAACGDWFIPDCAGLMNPGRTCTAYWDSVDTSTYGKHYFSNEVNPAYGSNSVFAVRMGSGGATSMGKQNVCYARAFRTVSY